MANYQNLKDSVKDVIKTNGNQEITGQIMQNVLLTIINGIGSNRTYAGLADSETNPDSIDANVFYIAYKEGKYIYFPIYEGNSEIVLNNGEIAILYNIGNVWKKETIGIGKLNYDLINSGILMYDSEPDSMGTGVLLDFGIDTLPDGYNKELYISFIRKSRGLIQVTDEDGKIVCQYFKNSEESGIKEVKLSSYGNSDINAYALINWDAINNVTSFSKKLHINKQNGYISKSYLSNVLADLQKIDITQLPYYVYWIERLSGDGTAGFDPKNKSVIIDKVISLWGKYDFSKRLILRALKNLSGGFPNIVIQFTTENSNEIIAQYAPNFDEPLAGIQTYKLSIMSGAPAGTEINITVNWDNISSNISPYVEVFYINDFDVNTPVDVLTNQTNESLKELKVQTDGIFEAKSWVENPNIDMLNGAILDVWNNNIVDKEETIYLGYVRRKNGLIQFWGAANDSNNAVAQFYSNDQSVRNGIEKCEVVFIKGNNKDKSFFVLINWDVLEETLYDLKDVEFPLSLMRTKENLNAYKRIGELENAIIPLFENKWITDIENNQLSVNIFGKVVSDELLNNINGYAKDIEIILLGDSLVGLERSSGTIPENESMFLPPDCQYYHWTWGLFVNCVKNKPRYDRIDALRDGSNVFTKNGEFEKITSGDGTKLDTPSTMGDWSVAANTYQSNVNSASVTFAWDLQEYEKLNIIQSFNPDGALCKILIGDGTETYNGKVEVSLDKEIWTEANNYEVNQNSNIDNLELTELEQLGKAIHQRHRRIWMRRKVNDETVTVKFQKIDDDPTKYMYFWGTERWNGNTMIFVNLGRGGRTTDLLNRNISDVIDRNPDCVIHSLSLANEKATGISSLETQYKRFFFGGNEGDPDWIKQRSMLTKSENYTKFSYLVVVPHGRGSDFVGNTTNVATIDDIPQYFRYKKMGKYVKDNSANYENLFVIDLYDQILNEGLRMGMTFESALIGTTTNPRSFTSDGIHLNRMGSALYTKYLASIFNSF